jgi:hypothetical protein
MFYCGFCISSFSPNMVPPEAANSGHPEPQQGACTTEYLVRPVVRPALGSPRMAGAGGCFGPPTRGPRARAERRVALDLGGEGGRGSETFDFRPIGPLKNPPKPTPQDPCRSALTLGLIVPELPYNT